MFVKFGILEEGGLVGALDRETRISSPVNISVRPDHA